MTIPQGEITIQTIAMPAVTNASGDIFGGWLVSQMDLAASVIAQKRSRGRVATVAIDSMVFHKPVHVGDLISCYAKLLKVGNTSMTINVEVYKSDHVSGAQTQVTEGILTFVALDESGLKRLVPKED